MNHVERRASAGTPIFVPDGNEKTYAEMSLEEKNQTLMRRHAAAAFREYLPERFRL
jgi:inosine/xanthosine triphosphate pyrophosphatase family protein